jgi:hypothetical protein
MKQILTLNMHIHVSLNNIGDETDHEETNNELPTEASCLIFQKYSWTPACGTPCSMQQFGARQADWYVETPLCSVPVL